MSIVYHSVNTRSYSAFMPLKDELTFNPSKNYLFDLSYLSVMSVNGALALDFLQGQLSCDLRKVTDNYMQQGAACNLKGRILALVDVIKEYNQDIKLILPNDLLEETKSILSKPALFSKVTFATDTRYQIFGFHLQQPEAQKPMDLELINIPHTLVSKESYSCYSLGNHHYILLVKSEMAKILTDFFAKLDQYRGSLAWHLLQLQNKRIEIYPDSRGLFLPHRVDLQNKEYLSFDKGCYKGQEIIARTHYRATIKHALKLMSIQTSGKLFSGQIIYSAANQQAVGELIDYCPTGDDKYLIAMSILIEHPELLNLEGHSEIFSTV